ncbi:transposase [Fibrobacteres bacterium R8-0-B4]
MCAKLGVSRSGYYKWASGTPSKREAERVELITKMREIFAEHDGRIGSPKMRVELAKRGVSAGKNRVARAMRQGGLRAKTHRPYRVTTDSNHALPIAENRLNREFSVAEPNKVLVSDITYVRTAGGWVYLAVFIDLFSRMVVGWAVSRSLKTEVVLTALERAVKTRGLKSGVMVHSDRGCQYSSAAFRAALRRHGFVQSMSRKGNCWDNAVAESFFRIYKTELTYHCKFNDLTDVWRKSFEYFECYYNRKRAHGTLNYMTPAEFESQFYHKKGNTLIA